MNEQGRTAPLAASALFALARQRQTDGWSGQHPTRVEDLLDAFPDLRQHPALVVELIYLEVLHRENHGERPTAEEYRDRFPEVAERLAGLFAVHEAVQDSQESLLSKRIMALAGGFPAAVASDPAASTKHLEGLVSPHGSVPPLAREWPLTIPGYEVLAEIGRGGMGVVYKARHLALNRLVALKMIRSGTWAAAEERERFRVEAEAVARLSHPNIVRIYEPGEYKGQPFFTMEWIEGESLASRLAGTPLAGPMAAALLRDLARAIQAAHDARIIHRDLKPGNVLLDKEGTPHVVDFGLAKRIDAEGLTGSGAIMGTPSYMAPEQARGSSKEIGPAADVYGLGAILYEMLTGRPPFKSENAMETTLQVLTDDPVAPRRLNPRAPRDLENICLKCLEKTPARRYHSAKALADDLSNFQEGRPVTARPVGTLERTARWARRRPLVAGLLMLLLAVAAVGASSFAWAYRHALDQRDRAIKAEGETQAELARALATSARLAARRGDWEKALGDYQAALKLDGEDEVALKLGVLECRTALYQIPQFREELADLAQRGDTGSHAGTIRLMQAYDVLASGRGVDGALTLLRQAREMGLPDAENAYAQALLAPTVRAATGHLRKAVRVDPAHRRSLELLTPLLMLQGRLDEARVVLVQLKIAAPNSLSGLIPQALLLAHGGNPEAGLRLCKRLVPVYGEEGSRFYEDLVRLTADWTSEDFLWSNSSDERRAAKWVSAASLLARLAALEKGAAKGEAAGWNDFLLLRLPCVQALLADPDLQGFASPAGLAQARAAPAKVTQALARQAEGWPNGYLHWLRAIFLIQEKKATAAENAILQALATPTFMRLKRRTWFELVRTRSDRARTLEGRARQDLQAQARRDLGRLLEPGGKYPAWAHYELFRVANDLGDRVTALAAAEAWERLSAGKPRAAEPLFTAEFRLGAYEKAAATARRMLRTKPDNPEVANWIGRAELERRFYRAALAAWLEMLRLDPNHKTARHNMVVLERRVRFAQSLNRYLLEKLRLKESLVLVRRGRHAEAVQLARRLIPTSAGGDSLLALACVEALASGSAIRDAGLSQARRSELVERYARNAINSLNKAKEKGYFADPAHVIIKDTEEDLAALVGRPDFQRLFARPSRADGSPPPSDPRRTSL